MQVGLYRKTVMKSLDTKTARLGLKVVSKNNARTTIALASVGLSTEIGLLLRALTPYILGAQMSLEVKQAAFAVMSRIGYHLTILCRVLKVKTPVASKKAKLTGTRTAAVMAFTSIGTDILRQFSHNFGGPAMEEVQRMIVLPKQGGAKEMRVVKQVDTGAEKKAEEERQRQLKGLVSAAVDLYWRLCFDIFGQPPATLFEADALALAKKMAPPKVSPLSSKADVVAIPKPKTSKNLHIALKPNIEVNIVATPELNGKSNGAKAKAKKVVGSKALAAK